MTYIDGFVAPVLPGQRETYAVMTREAAAIYLEHGALQVVGALSDDVPRGTDTDFYRAVAAKDDETICFSWIIWPSKEARNAGMAKVMADERMKAAEPTPFDPHRMILGGFEPVLDAKAG